MRETRGQIGIMVTGLLSGTERKAVVHVAVQNAMPGTKKLSLIIKDNLSQNLKRFLAGIKETFLWLCWPPAPWL